LPKTTTEITTMHRSHPTLLKFSTVFQLPHARALALASLLSLSACADKSTQTERNDATPTPAPAASAPAGQTAAANTTNANAAASPMPPPAPPQAAEVNDKIAKIFQGAVQIDSSQSPGVFVGDFNGDGSEDIAVVVRANADKLADINSEVSNWILIEPQKIALPDPNAPHKLPSAPPPVKVAANDLLLAVIHGYQQTGWRNPAAQQTYLLKNAVGRNLRAEEKQAALAEFKSVFPHLHTDIIREDLNGTPGFLCWAGASYGWIPATKHATK
jgi:hypothetical protein